MTSKQIKKYFDDGKIDELYAKCENYFALIDQWSDTLIKGDILNEFELNQCMEQCNGCQSKLNPIAGCLEAMYEEYVSAFQIEEESKLESLRVQDQNSAKAKARVRAGDLARYASDFSRYSFSAQSIVTTAQSRLKRLTVEKGNKGIDYTGDTSNLKQDYPPVLKSSVDYTENPRNKKNISSW